MGNALAMCTCDGYRQDAGEQVLLRSIETEIEEKELFRTIETIR